MNILESCLDISPQLEYNNVNNADNYIVGSNGGYEVNDNDIRQVTNERFFTRGKALQRSRSVFDMNIENLDGKDHISARIMGDSGTEYEVELILVNGVLEEYRCTCPATETYDDMCKHGVAVALEYVRQMQRRRPIPLASRGTGTNSALKNVLYHYSMEKQVGFVQGDMTGRVELEAILFRGAEAWAVEFRIGSERMYVLRDIVSFVRAMERKEKVSYGKQLAFIHERSVFTEESAAFADFLVRCVQYRRSMLFLRRSGWISSAVMPEKMRRMDLTTEELTEFLNLMEDKNCPLEDAYGRKSQLKIRTESPRLKIELTKGERRGYHLLVPSFEMICGQQDMYLILQDTAYHCSLEFKDNMAEFCTCGRKGAETSLSIAPEDMNVFCSCLYPKLLQYTDFHSQVELEPFMPEQCNIYIYLDKSDGRVTCRLESVYGEKKHDLMKSLEVTDLYRDLAAESRTRSAARAYFPQYDELQGVLWFDQEQDDLMFQLISTGVKQLSETGELYVSETLQQVSIRKAPSVGISIDLKDGLLDLQILSEHMPYEELENLLAAYRLRRKYHRLNSGDFLMLEDSALETLSELAEGLELSEKIMRTGHIQVPRYQSFYVDQVLKGSGNLNVDRSSAFKSLVRDMKSIEDSDFEVPFELKGVLRSYQKEGYRWLMTLEALGFGGILADDMGLGKSLQMLAFLYAKSKEHGPHRTSLLVCPASLVYNWQEEVSKFVPALKILLITGVAAERKEKLNDSGDYDLLITSYDLLKRDVLQYKNKSFYCQVLDEAQNIKNQTTKAAKAVKEINAQNRFALTGTPIENRLSELWSIFDYLMPGILGSYASFRKKYEIPIVQKGNKAMANRLQRMIRPFLLRRLKGDVLKELPEKIETIVYSKMECKQQELYRANAQKIMQEIAKGSGKAFETERIKILAGLTRLRQLCCDPHLLYENYEGQSAKLDTCMELVRTALAGGHKILLFSQFTSMLSLIEEKLNEEGISYHVLTGATSKEKRAELVRSYDSDDVPVFLISLKAGGTGLNLTAATIVIHFDPWWNLAAQTQATDRAHRIGQDQEVTVYKLIVQNSIEEKIQKLQEEKARLSDQIITEGTMSISALSREDFLELLEL